MRQHALTQSEYKYLCLLKDIGHEINFSDLTKKRYWVEDTVIALVAYGCISMDTSKTTGPLCVSPDGAILLSYGSVLTHYGLITPPAPRRLVRYIQLSQKEYTSLLTATLGTNTPSRSRGYREVKTLVTKGLARMIDGDLEITPLGHSVASLKLEWRRSKRSTGTYRSCRINVDGDVASLPSSRKRR